MGRTQRLAEPETFGKYQLIALLARGRMGNVYKAKAHGLEGFERTLVVKTVDTALAAVPGFVETVVAEAQRTVDLTHANVVQVLDLGQEDAGRVYIASEYVNGLDLNRARRIAQQLGSPWQLNVSVFIASEVAKGLDYAHRKKDFNFQRLNLMHRDLCPNNIMLSTDGGVKITDFGIVRAMGLVPVMDEAEQARRILYQSPEALRGEYTQLSDVFSLGLILYELVTGRHPYIAPTIEESMRRAQQAQMTPISQFSNLPRPLVQIIEGMLVPDPAGRTDSAGRASEELLGYIYSNNLAADARQIAAIVQELRRDEPDVFPDDLVEALPEEVAQPELSLSEIKVPEGLSLYGSAIPAPEPASTATPPPLPSHVRAQAVPRDPPTPEALRALGGSQLPASLEAHVQAALAGQGRAVLLHGQLGAGQDYLLDRMPHLLAQRPNVYAQAVQVTVDDRFRPFGALGDMLLACLRDMMGQGTDRLVERALQKLHTLGAEPLALSTLAHLWRNAEEPDQGYAQKCRALTNATMLALRALSQSVTVALLLDRVDHLDALSRDVLRGVLSSLGGVPVLLLMSVDQLEQVQAQLDTGNPAHLGVVKVVGSQPPKLRDITGLSEAATSMLAALALDQHPMHQSVLASLLSIPDDALTGHIRELVQLGVVRIPSSGYLFAARPELIIWAQETLGRRGARQIATSLWHHYQTRSRQSIDRTTPALIRLGILAERGPRILERGEQYAQWLQRHGWLQIALDFMRHAGELVKGTSAGTPEVQVIIMTRRAELAMTLADMDECMASLAPLKALSEKLRQERVLISALLLAGQLELQRDDLDEARRYYTWAVDAARGRQDPGLLAQAMLAMASWYERFGDPRRAEWALDGAMNLAERDAHLDPTVRAELLYRAVQIACARHTLARATRLCAELELLVKRAPSPALQCLCDAAHARIARARGDFPGALKRLVPAEQRAGHYRLNSLHIDLMRRHAIAALDVQNYKHAQRLANALVALSAKHEDRYSEQRAQDIQALSSCMLGTDAERAIAQLTQSLKRAQARGVPKDMHRCHRYLAACFERLGRPADAAAHAHQAAQLARQHHY